MTSIESLTLDVPDPAAASAFYTDAFGVDDEVGLRASDAPTDGFRGFTLSLVVSQPATVDGLIGSALDAGATPLKPVKKSFWGYGGVVEAPDGTIWKVATSSKKNTGPAIRQIDEIVLLLGVADVAASKRFYVDRGLTVSEKLRPQVRRVRHASRSSWRSTGAAPWPRTPASPRTAPARTESSSAATPAPSPTRTGSRGRQRERETVLQRSWRRRPPSRRRPDRHGFTAEERAAMKERSGRRRPRHRRAGTRHRHCRPTRALAEGPADRRTRKRILTVVRASVQNAWGFTLRAMPPDRLRGRGGALCWFLESGAATAREHFSVKAGSRCARASESSRPEWRRSLPDRSPYAAAECPPIPHSCR